MSDVPATPAVQPDLLSGINEANTKVRETAKWMATSFAAIGGVLVGGLGLSSLGNLTAETPDERVAAALAGLVIGVIGIGIGIWFTSRVLTPFHNTFRSADRHPRITDDVLGDGEILDGCDYQGLKDGFKAAREQLEAATEEDEQEAHDELAGWKRARRLALGFVGSRLLDRRFHQARIAMVVGVGLAALGVALFAWGANPPKGASDAAAALSVAPIQQSVQLTAAGVTALENARDCSVSQLTALAIGGKEGSREVVTVPAAECRSVRFVLTPRLGTAVAAAQPR